MKLLVELDVCIRVCDAVSHPLDELSQDSDVVGLQSGNREACGIWFEKGTERIHLLKIREIDSLRIVAAALVNRDQAFSFESLEGGPHRDSTDAKTRCKFFLHEPLFAKPPG